MKNYKYIINDLSTAKGGLISLSVFTLIFIGVFVFFYINFDAYSETVYSLKYQKDIEKGLAPTIIGWGVFIIPFALLGIFLLYKTKDFKQIGLGIDDNEIFLNTGMIRAVNIPFSNISEINDSEHYIDIKLKDYTQLINNQFFLFKSVIRRKYEKKESFISISKIDFEDEKGAEVYEYIKTKIS